MSSAPVVSVVIPFYNEKGALLNAIRSVFAQTLDDWELILVDDGSTDGSLDIARSVSDPRVRVVSDGRNLKLSARLNQIHPEAVGKYIARMDADDLMHPERLEKQIDLLRQRPEVDVVGTLMYRIDKKYRVYGAGSGGLAAREFSPRDTLEQAVLMHATITGKADWFSNNPYDETWPRMQDAELWCRTCRHSKFAQINEPLYFVDENDEEVVARYLRSRPFRRRIVLTYGPDFVGWPATLIRLARTYVKSAAYIACGLFNRTDILIGRRIRSLTPEETSEAQAAIEKIMNTTVPMKRRTG
jgi:glycosyltransferase involved in cell wall biosynthesis